MLREEKLLAVTIQVFATHFHRNSIRKSCRLREGTAEGRRFREGAAGGKRLRGGAAGGSGRVQQEAQGRCSRRLREGACCDLLLVLEQPAVDIPLETSHNYAFY